MGATEAFSRGGLSTFRDNFPHWGGTVAQAADGTDVSGNPENNQVSQVTGQSPASGNTDESQTSMTEEIQTKNSPENTKNTEIDTNKVSVNNFTEQSNISNTTNLSQQLNTANVADQVTTQISFTDTGNGDNNDTDLITVKGIPTIKWTHDKDATIGDLVDYVNDQINADNEKATVSPLMTTTDTSLSNAAPGWRTMGIDPYTGDGISGDYMTEIKDNQNIVEFNDDGTPKTTNLKEIYLDWFKNKPALAGFVVDTDGLDLSEKASDTVTLNLLHHVGTYKGALYRSLTREIDYLRYYGQDDTAEESSPVVQDVDHTDLSYASNGNTTTPALITDSNGKKYEAYYSIGGRITDWALGTPPLNYNDTSGTTTLQIIFPAETAVDRTNKQDGWTTFDDYVEVTNNSRRKPNNYAIVMGTFQYTDYNKKVHQEPKIDPVKVYYYHNQPVQVVFEDVTNGDNKAITLADFNAKDLTLKDNSKTIPATHDTAEKDNDNYTDYDYKTAGNYADGSITVDPTKDSSLKASDSLTYNDVLNDYLNNGYVLISNNVDNGDVDLTYNKDQVWNGDGKGNVATTTESDGHTLYAKQIVIKLKRTATKKHATKTVTRTIHFVADNAEHSKLAKDIQQTVTYSADYYVDNSGNVVNVSEPYEINGVQQQDADGNLLWLVGSSSTTPEVKWTTDNTSFAEVDDPTEVIDNGTISKNQINVPSGTLKGTWTKSDVAIAQKVSAPTGVSDTWDNYELVSDNKYKAPDVTLVYQKDVNAKIKYVDDTDKAVLLDWQDDTDSHGKVGDKINFAISPDDEIAKLEAKGYQLVRNDYADHGTYTDGDNALEVHFVHRLDSEFNTATSNRVIKYFDGKTGESLASIAPTVNQDVSFKQIKLIDATNAQVAGYNTTGNKADGQYTIDTKDETQSWVALDDNGKFTSVTSPDLTGDGYQKAPSFKLHENNHKASVVAEEIANPNKDADEVDVYYFHQTEQVTDKKTVNETVHYWYKDTNKPAANDYTATPKTFTRTGIKDLVTNKITWDSWSADQSFDAVESPELKGYTPDKEQIDKQSVSAGSDDLVFNVYYDKLPDKDVSQTEQVTETIHYIYKNGPQAGQKVQNDFVKTLNFKRDGKQDLATDETTWGDWNDNQKFARVDSPKIKGYDYDLAYVPEYTIDHDHEDIDVTVYYSLQPNKEVNDSKTITETIHYVYANGPHKGEQVFDDQTQTVNFSRTGSQSPVDDSVDWGKWSDDQTFDKVVSPTKKGYTFDKDQIDAQTVNANSDNLEFTVYYSKDEPKTVNDSKTVHETIHYWYKDTNKPAANDYRAEPLTFTRTGEQDPETDKITWQDWSDDQTFDAVTSPKIKGYTPDKEQIANQTVDHNSKDLEFNVYYDKLPDEKVSEDENVIQTIHYVYANGPKAGQKAFDDNVQTLNFSHSGTKDLVTDKITWQDWNDGQKFEGVKSPEATGYNSSQDVVKGSTVNHDSGDREITVYYTTKPDEPTSETKTVKETIHYIYENGPHPGEIVAKDHVATRSFTRAGIKSGLNGEVTWTDWNDGQSFDSVMSPVAKGYTADKTNVDSVVVNHDSDNVEVTVYYKLNDPKTVTDKANVTETIHYVYANGPKKGQKAFDDNVQTVNFNRTGSQDPVTDEITWGDWNDGQKFEAVKSPKAKGYDVSQDSVAEVTVNHDDKNIDVTVYYTIQEPKPTDETAQVTRTIHYIYKNGPNGTIGTMVKHLTLLNHQKLRAILLVKTLSKKLLSIMIVRIKK